MKISILPSVYLKKSLFLFISSILVSFICYLYIDKSFAFWAYEQRLSQFLILKRFTHLIEFLQGVVSLFYVYFVLRFFCQKVNILDRKLLTIANSLTLTYLFKDQLKFIFGRYWPLTWTHGNPSLIEHNAYGFHFFQSGSWYQSFPSGHTALTFAAMTALWISFPRLRWVSAIFCFLTVIGLLGMNYHFVSDVIAGGILGFVVGYCTTKVMEQGNEVVLAPRSKNE